MQNIEEKIESFDVKIINFMKKHSLPMARWAIFIVYFWFGILKVFSLSPANPIVADLLSHTLPFISFNTFILSLGIFEMIIAFVFIIKGFERLAFLLLVIHLITTIMPLFILPTVAWQSFLVPTLEGQYILKNVLIIACAMGIVSRLHPLQPKTNE